MKIINTGEPQFKPSVLLMVYGEGGVGKTTFAATAPKPILADCENGAKYFGLRGIHLDVAQIKFWSDMKDFAELAKTDKYESVIIDPIGELMEKLKTYMVSKGDRKLVQSDGSPSMAGWGWLKDTMRTYIKFLRDSGKHVILIAHIDEKNDEERIIKRPMIQTKVSNDLVNMVDIVGYMTVIRTPDGEEKRIIYVDPASDKFVCKDRTGQLGKYIEPDFKKIIKAVQGTEAYSWSKKKPAKEKEEKPVSKAKTPKKGEVDIPVINEEENTTPPKNTCPNCEGPISEAERKYSERVYKQVACRNCQRKLGAVGR